MNKKQRIKILRIISYIMALIVFGIVIYGVITAVK